MSGFPASPRSLVEREEVSRGIARSQPSKESGACKLPKTGQAFVGPARTMVAAPYEHRYDHGYCPAVLQQA
jgi:hypothetical protein